MSAPVASPAPIRQTGIGSGGQFKKTLVHMQADYQLYLLFLPILAYFIIFKYIPMYGLRMAFQEYNPFRGFGGSPWVGFDQFMRLFTGPYFMRILKNTLLLSLYSLAAGMPFPILFALLLNSIRRERVKKIVQTVSYAPHFISTVVIVGMLRLFLSPSTGVVNELIKTLGGASVNFFAKAGLFPSLYVWSGIWQDLGWGAVIYIAALSSIDPQLHEAAVLDGAGRLRRIWHIDLPGILPTIIILLILSLGNILSVGFEKVYLMQTDLNLSASETIATYTYKAGLVQAQYSFSAAVGFFSSMVNIVLLVIVNNISRRVTETSLW